MTAPAGGSETAREIIERTRHLLRGVAVTILTKVRRSDAGRTAARFVRHRAPGPYTWVVRRYQAYSLMPAMRPRFPSLRFVAPQVSGLSPDAQMLVQRLALAARHTRSAPGQA